MFGAPRSPEIDALANHKSAEKRARQNAKRRDRNRTVRARTRSVVRGVRADLEQGTGDLAVRAREAESALRRAATKGVIPKRRASRLVSRIAKHASRSNASHGSPAKS